MTWLAESCAKSRTKLSVTVRHFLRWMRWRWAPGSPRRSSPRSRLEPSLTFRRGLQKNDPSAKRDSGTVVKEQPQLRDGELRRNLSVFVVAPGRSARLERYRGPGPHLFGRSVAQLRHGCAGRRVRPPSRPILSSDVRLTYERVGGTWEPQVPPTRLVTPVRLAPRFPGFRKH